MIEDPFETLDAFVESGGEEAGRSKKKQSVATRLVSLVADLDLFVSTDITPEPFADLTENGVRRTLPIEGGTFKKLLTHRYFEATGHAATDIALRDAARVIAARAEASGVRRPVTTRIGHHGDAVYIDLGDETGAAIEVSGTGWRLTAAPPVRFHRPAGALPLPAPERGAKLEELKHHIACASDAAFASLCAWLVYALGGVSAFPIAVITGDHGAAKTTTSRMLKALVDPHHAQDGSAPRGDDDVWARARNHRVLAYDNVSSLSAEQSDLLCKIATGYAMERRRLYSNVDVVGATVCRPQIANGIVEFANRPDLLDRALLIRLSRIPEADRKPEQEVWSAFYAARPKLLGALCDALRLALQGKDGVRCDATARLADFHRYALAAEPAFAAPGAFEQALRETETEAAEIALGASLIGETVLSLMSDKSRWSGSATELLQDLRFSGGEDLAKTRGFPKTASHISGDLKRIAHSLRRVGILASFHRTGERGRWIELERIKKS